MTNHVWCEKYGIRKGFWLHKDACLKNQKIPGECRKKCEELEERKPKKLEKKKIK